MDSVLIICDKGAFGTNSANEAIRIGSGFLALGEDIKCKIILIGDAVNFLNRRLDPAQVGMDSLDSGLEMADLTDMELILVQESLKERGMDKSDLIDYARLQIKSLDEVAKITDGFDAIFKI